MLTIYSTFYYVYDNETTLKVKVLMGISLSSYILPVMLNCCHINLIHTFFGMFSYLFLAPTYINVFVVYSFSNIHDVTWGNRATTNGQTDKKQDDFKHYRS